MNYKKERKNSGTLVASATEKKINNFQNEILALTKTLSSMHCTVHILCVLHSERD